MEHYIISEEELKDLIQSKILYLFLIYDGIDDGIKYEAAMNHYEQAVKGMVEKELRNYPRFFEKKDFTLLED